MTSTPHPPARISPRQGAGVRTREAPSPPGRNFFEPGGRGSRRGRRLGRKPPKRSEDQEPFPAARPPGRGTSQARSSPADANPRPDAEARVRAPRNCNGTEQAFALISGRPGQRPCPRFSKAVGAQSHPEGRSAQQTGRRPHEDRTPRRRLTCTRRRAATRDASRARPDLPLPPTNAARASGAEPRLGTNPGPAQICLLSRGRTAAVHRVRRSAATEDESPARSDLPTHERECAPERSKYGTDQAGASLHSQNSAQRPCVGRRGNRGCTRRAPQPHSGTDAAEPVNPQTGQASGQSLTNS